MSASVKQLPNEDVVIVSYAEPFNPAQDVTYAKHELEKILASKTGPVNAIVDLSQIRLSFADLVASMGQTVDPDSETAAQKGRLISTLVGSTALIKMAADAYAQEQYGGMKVEIFPTVEAALDHIHKA